MPRVILSDADRIAETAFDVLFEKWPDWTDEELLRHPTEALVFVKEVRRRMSKPTLAENEICGALTNARKRGRVPERHQRRRRTRR